MAFAQFDRSRLRLQPLAERTHDVDRSCMVYPDSPREPFDHAALPELAERIVEGARAGSTVMFCCGAHVLRKGNGPLLIDLMERRLLTHLALNGAGAIHDFELAMIGSTCESVARYVRTGEFGLWNETGRINDAAVAGARDGIGFGEAVGRMIEEEQFPVPRDERAGGRLPAGRAGDGPRGDRPGHHPRAPQFRPGGHRRGHLRRFPRLHREPHAAGRRRLPEHRHRRDGARGVPEGPDHGPQRRPAGRPANPATSPPRCSTCAPLGGQLDAEAAKTDPQYYFRPYKTILVRTVADGGKSYYVEGDHRSTVPALYDQILARAQR